MQCYLVTEVFQGVKKLFNKNNNLRDGNNYQDDIVKMQSGLAKQILDEIRSQK